MKQSQSPRGGNRAPELHPAIKAARAEEDARVAAYKAEAARKTADIDRRVAVEREKKSGQEFGQTWWGGAEYMLRFVPFSKGRREAIKSVLVNIDAELHESKARLRHYAALREKFREESAMEARRQSHFNIYDRAMRLAFEKANMTVEEFSALEKRAEKIARSHEAQGVLSSESEGLVEMGGQFFRVQLVPVTEEGAPVPAPAEEETELQPLNTFEANYYIALEALVYAEYARRSRERRNVLVKARNELNAAARRLRGIHEDDIDEPAPAAAKAVRVPISTPSSTAAAEQRRDDEEGGEPLPIAAE
ncbi:hypothetical protein K2Y00_04125 [Patescibacteria group bacterium]|nr:hypothetical protein [Patescibacteria group bacterium]